MNTGIIASRYATALLKLVEETGGGETVIRQVEALSKTLDVMPELRRAVDDSKTVSSDQKLALFETVLDEELAPELRKFIGLVIENGRVADIRLIFKSFISDYYNSKGIIRGKLILPSANSPQTLKGLVDKLEMLVHDRTGKKLLLTTEVNESLIGGFVFEVEDQLLDASVSHQLEMIRRQFIERNRRIV